MSAEIELIIVDDDAVSAKYLEGIINKNTNFKVNKTFEDPVSARNYLLKNKTDLLFLDINMPEMSGYELIDSLPNKPEVIVMTSSEEHAYQSYSYCAVDFLLKPLNTASVLKALDKFSVNNNKDNKNSSAAYFFVKDGNAYVKVNVDEVVCCESMSDYVKIFLSGGKYICTLMTMKKMERLLPEKHFIRVHKSYIVSLNKIKRVENHLISVEGISIPVGRVYRKVFYESLAY